MQQQNSKVTMQMIADQLGITKVSVSKALNNQPGVSAELKKRIIETAKELGYPSTPRKAQAAAPQRLEFIISKRFFLEDDKFYTVIYYTLARLCNDRGIRLSLSVVGTTDEGRLALPAGLVGDRPDGIFLGGELSYEYMSALVQSGIPAVAIDFCHPDLPVDSVVVDNFFAAYRATKYLMSLGHRDIGFVGEPQFSSSIMDRYLGYVKALQSSNIPIREDWCIANNDRSGSYAMSYALPATLPTAFLCHCDMAAYYLMIKLRGEGFDVPGDVSLLSFDNTDLSRSSIPMISTIDIDKKKMARLAFDKMLHRIENPDDPHQRIVMDAKLIERDTVTARR